LPIPVATVILPERRPRIAATAGRSDARQSLAGRPRRRLGAILRAAAPVEVDDATLSVAAIGEVVRGEGHYLGNAETLRRMETDFLYPRIADRRSPAEWEADGAQDIRQRARRRAREILAAHFPAHVSERTERLLRRRFDIRLPREAMTPP
jgi:trimethylamine--corrinoid protein Co-methyltransferase